jgi:SAM-dependent MidA family methyltransferase
LRELSEECFAAVSYVILEPFSIRRERQQRHLRNFSGKIFWLESIAQLRPFAGIHFSNELFDSMPVHLIASGGVAKGATNWKEKFVAVSGNNFAFTTAKVSRSELRLRQLGFFPRGFETEVSVVAPKLMREIALKLSRGVVLTIDYGFVRAEFYALDRGEGSLQIRAKQKKLSSSFQQIGCADISTHVEWTGLAEAALSSGAKPIGFTDQHHFLTGIVSKFFTKVEFDPSEKRALQTLLHPEMLGRNFQALALGKNFADKLSGFQFARDPFVGLGVGGTSAVPSQN